MQFRNSAIWLYRQMTSLTRRRLLAQLREQNQLPVAVLFYHRVANHDLTPWSISVSDFKRHLDWLQKSFDLVSLSEAQRRIQSPHNDRLTVAITFDDGYAENAETAIPELINRQIPVTYFVATDFIANSNTFPHDAQAGYAPEPNSWEQLRAFAELGVEFGAHTRSHINVSSIRCQQQLHDEIIGSIEVVEAQLATKCHYFAFPYGQPHNFSQAAVAMLRQHGIRGVCSAYGALNWPGNEGFHIRRIHGDPSLERLKNWLTLDHRHLVDNQALPFDEPTHLVPITK